MHKDLIIQQNAANVTLHNAQCHTSWLAKLGYEPAWQQCWFAAN